LASRALNLKGTTGTAPLRNTLFQSVASKEAPSRAHRTEGPPFDLDL
jgi:hypothetical protein